MTKTPHFINGAWVEGSGKNFSSTNPANGQMVWEGNAAGENEVDAAMRAARNAFKPWANKPYEERLKLVEGFRALLEENKADMAEAIAQETGKPLWDCANEVAGMIGKVAVSAQAYKERTATHHGKLPEAKSVVKHKPHGVMTVFGPYNFPGHLPNGHIVPALLAGNTVVFKPSEVTPRVAEKTVKLWEKTGLPVGVINLVQGERDTGVTLASHKELDGLLFTGSSETGLALHKQFAGRPEIILALEMGGNNPLVIWNVKDYQAAAYHAVQSAFLSTGQRCSCARRIIISSGPEGDAFLKHFIAMAQTLRAGAYHEQPEPFMGPMVSDRELNKVLNAQEELKKAGAKVLLECTRRDEKALFLTAGILDVTAVENRPDREVFGPLAQIIRVGAVEQAIKEANNTRYGLTAGLLSDEQELFEHFVREIHAGVINWNRPTTGASSSAPYGGLGISGNHRPAAYYAADYCAYPVASSETETLRLPDKPTPGVGV